MAYHISTRIIDIEQCSFCGGTVGSVYNYFPSKADLLSATIENVWDEILMPFNQTAGFNSFTDCVSCLFEIINKGIEQYPGFFTVHSLNFASTEKAKRKVLMEHYFDSMKEKLVHTLDQDKHIRADAFQNGLPKDIFAEYIFTLLLSALIKKQTDCQPLLEMIKEVLYAGNF